MSEKESRVNVFPGIKLGDTQLLVKYMLIPWKSWGLLDCIGGKIHLDQILTLEQLVELYVYMGAYNYVKGNEKIMTSVYRNLKTAKTFDDYNRDTIQMNRDYSGSGLEEACNLLLDGKEVFCYIDFAYRVRFFKQSQLIIQMISNPRRFFGTHGIWIDISAMLREVAKIKFQKKKSNDRVLKELKSIYHRLAKGIKLVQRTVNPTHERIYDLMKQPDSEIVIYTNNQGRITSVKQGVKKGKGGKNVENI